MMVYYIRFLITRQSRLECFLKKWISQRRFMKSKIQSYIKHYIKVSRLMFDVYKSHVERGELLIKVSSVLFSNQNCVRKVKVRYSSCLVR